MEKHPEMVKGLKYQLKKVKPEHQGTLNLKDLEAYIVDRLKDKPKKKTHTVYLNILRENLLGKKQIVSVKFLKKNMKILQVCIK